MSFLVSALRQDELPPAATLPLGVWREMSALREHPDYASAKAGNPEAAARLISDVMTPQLIAQARAKFGESAIFVPVHAIEANGENMLPRTYAQALASATGGSVSQGIVQANRAFHTGAKAMERLVVRPVFDGPLADVAGKRFVVVDDVTTMGSTLAELADHISAGGGEVIGSAVLVNAARGATLQARRSTATVIERRYGNLIRELFGISPQALTGPEAAYLIGFRDADALRNRAVAALAENQRRAGRRGAAQEPEVPGGAGEVPLASRAARPAWVTDGSAALRSAAAKIDTYAPSKTITDKAREMSAGWKERLVQGMLDAYAPLKALSMDAYIAARMVKAADGALEGMLMYGKPVMDAQGGLSGDPARDNNAAPSRSRSAVDQRNLHPLAHRSCGLHQLLQRRRGIVWIEQSVELRAGSCPCAWPSQSS